MWCDVGGRSRKLDWAQAYETRQSGRTRQNMALVLLRRAQTRRVWLTTYNKARNSESSIHTTSTHYESPQGRRRPEIDNHGPTILSDQAPPRASSFSHETTRAQVSLHHITSYYLESGEVMREVRGDRHQTRTGSTGPGKTAGLSFGDVDPEPEQLREDDGEPKGRWRPSPRYLILYLVTNVPQGQSSR